MSTSTETVTKYAVARGEKIIAGEHTTPEAALSELQYIERQMRSIGLEPDVHVVTFDVTTTVKSTRPHVYKPEPEVEEGDAVAEPATGYTDTTEA